MISTQVLANCIEELHNITKVDLCVYDADGIEVVSTFDNEEVTGDMIRYFIASPADSQVIGIHHLLKVSEEGELLYALVARGSGDESYMVGKIAVSQLLQLQSAYKERFDRNNFFQNLLMDNLLLVDVYNRAKKLHVEVAVPRVVLLVEADKEKDSTIAELLRGMFSSQSGDFVTAVDENNVILIKSLEPEEGYEEIHQVAQSIVDTISAEAMTNVRVAYGTIVQELKDVSKSYKEAMMAISMDSIRSDTKMRQRAVAGGNMSLINFLPFSSRLMHRQTIFFPSGLFHVTRR